MKVLVTGSTGAVGRRVCVRLAEVGYDVVGVDRRSSVVPADGVELVTADLEVVNLHELFHNVDAVAHLASGLRPQEFADDPSYGLSTVAQRLISALSTSGVKHLIVISTAMVYGAWPDNPVPLTEEAEIRPCPGFRFAERRVELEGWATSWAEDRTDRVTTILRPAVTVAEEKPGGLARLLTSASLVRSEDGDSAGQFLHADDLAEAVVVAVDRKPPGALNVAPDGWIPSPLMVELGGPVPRLRLSANLVRVAARIRWGLGLTGAPPGIHPYTVHSWVVANDRLRELGWVPKHSNEEAYVAGHEPRALDQLDARSRQFISLGVSALFLMLIATGFTWLVRRIKRG